MAGPREPAQELTPEDFVQRLDSHERVLVELKDKLYEGSWERVLGDLRARLQGGAYIYKLSQNIARDIASIEKMKAYEERCGINLSVLLKKMGLS